MNAKNMHLLVDRAFRYPAEAPDPRPEGCRYDRKTGAWMMNEDGREVMLVTSTDPRKPLRGTKKADRETGEDQKSR